jgi:sialic acid synthase SpsE
MDFFKNLVDKSKGGVYIIAEACDNHMGSLEIARSLVRSAKNSGADAVKFQHHIADEEMLKSAKMSDNFDEHLFDFLINNSLTLREHRELKGFCDKLDITYLCTPFSFKAACEISELVPFFKIGSGEFIDHWYVDKLKILKKPLLFSSGMCSENELKENIDYLKKACGEISILNCLSEYPPKLDHMNLGFVKTLADQYPDLVIGHSDHTQTVFTSVIAAALGARIFEKHMTVSSFISGPDKDVSLEPSEFKVLVDSLRNVRATLGEVKIVHDPEKSVRQWAYRSIVTTRKLEIGHVITDSDICSKRPGTGIPSKEYKQIIGKEIKVKINKNELIQYRDLL